MKGAEKRRKQGIKIIQMTERREIRLACIGRKRQQEVMEGMCWPKAGGESNKG